MEQLLVLIFLPVVLMAQEELSFSNVEAPIIRRGQTDHGLKLEFREKENIKYYRWSFPVNELEADLGSNQIEFEASDAELEALRVHMIKSMTGVFDKTDYTIGNYFMEIFTNRKELHGKDKQIGKTQVTILSKDHGAATDKIIYDGKVQEGFFTITEGQVNVLFGKAKF